MTFIKKLIVLPILFLISCAQNPKCMNGYLVQGLGDISNINVFCEERSMYLSGVFYNCYGTPGTTPGVRTLQLVLLNSTSVFTKCYDTTAGLK